MSDKKTKTYVIPPNNQPTITTSPGVDSVQFKKFTGSGSFDVREEMLKDSTDLLDNVEVTTIAQECVKLKAKEDEIAKL